MITIHLEDLTYGIRKNIEFDLDNYSNKDDLLEDFYSELNEYTEDEEIEYTGYDEFRITDIDFYDLDLTPKEIGFRENMNLDLLIELNDLSNDKDDVMKIKLLLDQGNDLKYTLDNYENINIEVFEKTGNGFDYDFGKYITDEWDFLDIPEDIKRHIDFESLGHYYGNDYICVEYKGNWVISNY